MLPTCCVCDVCDVYDVSVDSRHRVVLPGPWLESVPKAYGLQLCPGICFIARWLRHSLVYLALVDFYSSNLF